MRGQGAVKLRVVRKPKLRRLPPPPEPHQHMRLEAQVGLEVIRHRRALHPQQFLRHGLERPAHRPQRRFDLAKEHRAVDDEMVIVQPVAGIDVVRPALPPEPLVRQHRRLVPVHHVLVMPAEHVDMRGHMDQVARIGHQRPQRVAGLQRLLGEGRHLHQVHVEMQDTRMPHRAGQRHGLLQHRLRLPCPGAGGGLTAGQVPHLPRGDVEQGFGKDGADLELVRVVAMDRPHRVGEIGVPAPHHLQIGRLALWIARRQRPDQRRLPRRHPVRQRKRLLRRVMPRRQRRGTPGLVEQVPRHVVIRPRSIPPAPISHCTARIGGEGPVETGDRLLVIVPVGPQQAPVEPELRLVRARGHRKTVGPQIEISVHADSPCPRAG